MQMLSNLIYITLKLCLYQYTYLGADFLALAVRSTQIHE